MVKKVRAVIFWVCLFLFLLAAPLTIFYSQGYRFDLNPPAGGKKITQTGGIFLKVIPKQAEIYLNEKLKKKTDFFFGSALVENLLPRKYKIEVKKEGYLSWQKSLEVKEKEVTEVKNIILFPQNLNFTVLTKGVENFWLSLNKKELVLKEKGGQGWSLKLYDLETNIKSHLIAEGDIFSKGADLLNLEFSADNPKKISLETRTERGVEMKANSERQTSSTSGAREELKYFTLEIDKTPPSLKEEGNPALLPENIVTSQTFDGDSYYLDNLGNFFKDGEGLTRTSFPVKAETDYDIKKFQNFIFLRENQDLYWFNLDSKSFERYFDGIKGLKISSDKNKLVLFSNHEIWILFLQEKLDPPQKKAGDKILIARLSEKIKDCFWLNPDYLIFNTTDTIKIAETDDRDQINIIDLTKFKEPEMFWNSFNKKLYLLSSENLYASAALF